MAVNPMGIKAELKPGEAPGADGWRPAAAPGRAPGRRPPAHTPFVPRVHGATGTLEPADPLGSTVGLGVPPGARRNPGRMESPSVPVL